MWDQTCLLIKHNVNHPCLVALLVASTIANKRGVAKATGTKHLAFPAVAQQQKTNCVP